LLGSIPYLAKYLDDTWQQISAAGGTTLLGSIFAFFQARQQQGSARAEGQKSSSTLKIIGISFLLIYGLMLSAFFLAQQLSGYEITVPILVALIVGFFVNLNHAGLDRMYRDRLMETFMPDPESVATGKWRPAIKANETLLENICPSGMGLYQLINTNVVLVDSADAKFRGRGGDSFLLSRLFCGSYATGWCKTNNYMKSSNSFFSKILSARGMTLPTATAISGAAANPNSGVSGKGVTRNKLVSTLMSLLNFRLGYWARNPQRKCPSPTPPNYFVPGIFPGILPGIFGVSLNENNRFLELTDGGHFENLALYELIRREVNFIVVTDGGADPDYTFEDLANAVERIRVDYGVKIRFRTGDDCDLEGILPKSAEDGLATQKYALAKRGFAIADIIYGGDKPDGTLIYIKPTLIPNLPEDIYGYKSSHTTFPDQTTADQFFDEAQFEAYRELGFQLAKQMLTQKSALGEFKKFFN
ncbi:MAG: hypothetical protein KAJ10_13875, partial [Thermodesulfovibrionia bacterium]|nr:hypothetical protein [Thermodesulfovibrionia bacterium]